MSPADSPFAPLPAPGPHPALAELRAYAAGTLAPADEYRIEAHTLDCERCADLVEGFSMSDATTTDHAVAELRTRLQARIGPAETIEPVAARWAWPRLAAAAAVVLGVVGGGIWGWEQRDTASSSTVATTQVEISQPAASPEPPTPARPAPETPVAAAPAAPKDAAASSAVADYAAVVPPAQLERRAAPRGPLRTQRPVVVADAKVEQADMADLPNTEAVASAAVATEAGVAPPAAAPAASPAAPAEAIAQDDLAANAPAKKRAGLLQGRIAADSSAPARQALVASASKAKTLSAPAPAPDAAAPAIVPNTPMPTTPAINPAPVVGTIAFREYLRREAAAFDPEINNLRLSGTVRIRFVVGADGKLSHLKVMRGLRKDYDDEALRLVCEGPTWQPGIASGKRAPLPMEVTVPF
jgi:hypothetical protein